MNILFIGDIVGYAGRQIIKKKLPELLKVYQPDFVLCNAENAAGGLGINAGTADEILELGIDAMSLGNHIWSRREWQKQAYRYTQICRPINAPKSWPGFDHVFCNKDGRSLLLINVLGQAFMQPLLDNPFLMLDEKVKELKDKYGTKNVIIDMHAETTAEKIMLTYFLEDQVTAVLGTHTHVQTADEKIIGNGTGFITDVGMTGPANGVLGMSKKTALCRAVQQLPAQYALETDPQTVLNAVLLNIDHHSGQTLQIERLCLKDEIF